MESWPRIYILTTPIFKLLKLITSFTIYCLLYLSSCQKLLNQYDLYLFAPLTLPCC
ncbi:hypothetical protein BDV40DRAFT_261012 [Aspergillus tamarii]|uniref:Uncharacterized protein n=1 Tax=Aspergillus tamarii TaxID=41984 RepID=A0A5N6UZQ4_ASPTM|nr:hypothetical protein BDV40DRAFT_261012 [Aspergillus tamarii]